MADVSGENAPEISSASEIYDTIVIGAGLSGLSAARELVKMGKHVLVLEAKDRVGGRTYTIEDEGLMWDLGGQWVATSQPHIMRTLEELGIETYPQYIEGNKVMQTKDGKVTVYSDEGFGNLPLGWRDVGSLLQTILRIELVSRQISSINPAAHGAKYDIHTVAGISDQWCGSSRARELVDVVLRVCMGTESSLVSALYFLAYCRGTGGLAALCEARNGGGQELRIKGGAQQISEKLAASLGPSGVRFATPVVAVEQVWGEGCAMTW